MKLWDLNQLKSIPKLKLAVVGHVEWVRFLTVDQLPKAGVISHAKSILDEPAGGGALAAITMQKLIDRPVNFFTSLGRDSTGEKCYERLKDFGLNLNIAWRNSPTRKGISFVDSNGERAIIVIGDRLQPTSKDPLPWEELCEYDGIFFTAGDFQAIKLSRKAKLLVLTPRVGIETINQANEKIDLIVGSGLDPDEKFNHNILNIKPKFIISTKGSNGGEVWPGGKYKAVNLKSKTVDSYGCGDNFAAGVTTGLAANWDIEQAISLGAHCGAKCATHFGPY